MKVEWTEKIHINFTYLLTWHIIAKSVIIITKVRTKVARTPHSMQLSHLLRKSKTESPINGPRFAFWQRTTV